MDKEELWCMKKILVLLNKTKQEILDIWQKQAGFDLAYFDVLIDLSVKIDNTEVRVKDCWSKMPYGA